MQSAHFWFKVYINTMTLLARFNQCKTYPCLLYIIYYLNTVILIVYVDDTLEIWNKPALMDTI